MYKIGILISGTGSNMKSLIDYSLSELNSKNPVYSVKKVISDREAKGMETAKSYGIKTALLDRKDKNFTTDLTNEVKNLDILVLAGFLSIVPSEIIELFKGRIINIHPSLLPKYGGIGMYGIKVHEKVIDKKDKESGCTVHLVTDEVDGGDILVRKIVHVENSDTAETLQKRILVQEHVAIVEGLLKLIKNLEGEMNSRNALISVYDKTGVKELAEYLSSTGWNIISSGGTYKFLKDSGFNVKMVEDVTGSPEILNGRVKTLHPRIHGGILAVRGNKEHMETLERHDIGTIDLVCVNLYPFEMKAKENLSFDEMIEFIDIGGPSMLRSAAKNFKDVIVLSDPNQYESFIEKSKEGTLDIEYRGKLAFDVFSKTSHYDNEISKYLKNSEILSKKSEYEEETLINISEDSITLSLDKVKNLKYGENPHQKGAFYKIEGVKGFMTDFEQLKGNELGYINYKDLESAWRIVCDFDEIACAAIKHNTPCGVALGDDPLDAYSKAFRCDPVSIFGGIVAVNREIDGKCASKMSEIMLHIVAAPGFTDEALEILNKKKNLIVIKMNSQPSGNKTIVSCDGGLLIQDDDIELFEKTEVVTKKAPTADELEEMKFAMQVVKFVKSNAIVVSRNKMAVGIGGGFVNRIDAAEYALKGNEGPLVMASDAFFPFDDVVNLAGKMGVTSIVQPGGSVNDKLSVDKCDELGISMVITGMRHFRH